MFIHYTYKITNLINGKMYIGKHTQEFGFIDDYMGSGKIIKKSIDKYGLENFKKDILEFHESSEEAYEAEAHLITKDIVESDLYYNVVYGGKGFAHGDKHTLYGKVLVEKDGSRYYISKDDYYSGSYKSHLCGKKHSEESKEKMRKPKSDMHKENISNARIGMIFTDEHKENISLSKRNEKSIFYNSVVVKCDDGTNKIISIDEYNKGNYKHVQDGVVRSNEFKENLSSSRKGENNPAAVKVSICGTVYNTRNSAAEALNVSSTTIRNRCLSQKEMWIDWFYL